MGERKTLTKTIQSNLILGVLTIIPLIVVWFVLDFIFDFLSSVGAPVASGLAMFIADRMPEAQPLLDLHAFRWLVAVAMSLLLIYLVGYIASRVAGRKLIAGFEGLIARIPLVESVYSASKKLVNVMQQSPEDGARVVLVDFPHPGMKAIGLVMRNFRDSNTGQELAVVFVPTAPNPTGGYVMIIAVERLIPTAMTMDQAMAMVVSGGTVAPERLSLTPSSPILEVVSPPPLAVADSRR